MYYNIFFILLGILFITDLYKLVPTKMSNGSSYLEPKHSKFEAVIGNGYIIILMFFLILMLGNRGLTGTDSITYSLAYNQILPSYFFEPLYRFIQSFFIDNGLSFSQLQMFIAILTVGFSGIAFVDFGVSIPIMLLMYYSPLIYFNSFNIARQQLAISIYVLAVYFLLKKLNTNKLKFSYVFMFLVAIVAAYNIHHTIEIAVLFFVISYLMIGKNFKRIMFVIKTITFFGVIGLKIPITAIGSFLGVIGLNYFETYANSQYLQFTASTFRHISLILVFLLMLLIDPKKLITKFEKFIYVQLVICGFISAFFGDALLILRIQYYMQAFFPFLFATVWVQKPSTQMEFFRTILTRVTILVFICIYFYTAITYGWNGINPYLGKLFG